LSDHELSDIVTAIQARPPVDRDMGSVHLGLMFSLAVLSDPTLVTAQNVNHQAPHPLEPPGADSPLALGAHIALACTGCHGANYSGGKLPDPNMPIVANLTPHATGLKGWSETDFLKAMHTGIRPNGTKLKDAMPWAVYGKMSDVELKAIWTFLQTLPPTPKGVRT
jgi:cytochrome c553